MRRIKDTTDGSGLKRGRTHRRSGQAMVEMALCLVILIPIVIGIIEFGWLLKNINQLNNAAREGARAAAVGRTTTDIKLRVGNMSKPLVIVDSLGNVTTGTITLTYSDDNGTTYSKTLSDTTTVPPTNNALGSNLIKVQVDAVNPSLTSFFPYLTNKPIQGFAVMRREF